jgi:predicted membrane channel-forming protein YqfA (hemolysin III family)
MDEIVREFFAYVKARWHRKSTLVIIVLFSSLVLLWMFSGINLREITKAQLWIGGGFLLILVGFWIYSTRIPKVSKGKIGFAIGIKTDNPNQQLKIKRDFIDALRELLYKSKPIERLIIC